MIARSKCSLRYPAAGYISSRQTHRQQRMINGKCESPPAFSAGYASAAERRPATASQSAAPLAGASLDGPLVAHVKDLSTGEIGVYMGTSEVIVRDPQLAAMLYRTTTKG